jgi:hypothetical protein
MLRTPLVIQKFFKASYSSSVTLNVTNFFLLENSVIENPTTPPKAFKTL